MSIVNRQPLYLPALVHWMSLNTSSEERWEVVDIANATGIKQPTVRRLLNNYTGIFHRSNSYPIGYFYVPGPEGQRIIDRFETSAISRMERAPIIPVVTVPNNTSPVAEASKRWRYMNVEAADKMTIDQVWEYLIKIGELKTTDINSRKLLEATLYLMEKSDPV